MSNHAVAEADARAAGSAARPSRQRTLDELGPNYKWIALSNTTLGMLIATINSSIVLIALPDIFKGINLNPLEPQNTSYLLWMMMGFLVVTAVLVVSFGRLGDMFGRARMYNMGFAIFTVSSIFLAITWFDGSEAAIWLIFWRIIQGVGGAFLMANSSAILTDAFPANQRGLAMGINGVAAIAGSFLGLLIGGVLAPIQWHFIFLVSVPFGVVGTIWAYLKLHDTGERRRAKMDWWGNITFAVGLIAILIAITYGIQPYGTSNMGWGNPWVLTGLIGGVIVLIAFVFIETKVDSPLFELSLFKNRSFAFGNLANLMASIGRGGLQFILIIWLQGIWLPQHGFDYSRTPLWAGIYMVPMTIGFLLSAPVSGFLSDRLGTKWFTTIGMLITAGTFAALIAIPVDFTYWVFAVIMLINGIGMGLFASPNRAEVMNSLPITSRGSGAGMMTTFQNAAMVLSIGLFFSLMIAGLSKHLPTAMLSGLTANGMPDATANGIAHLPTVGILFAAFLGYNPIREVGGQALQGLPQSSVDHLTGLEFFPHLISDPFSDGLTAAFTFALICCVLGAIASLFTGGSKKAPLMPETVGAELAAVAADAGVGTPSELIDEPRSAAAADSLPRHRLTSAGTAGSQAERPRIAGRITTADGVPLADSAVTVTDVRGHQAGSAAVHADGSYGIHDLADGTYTVIATAPGRSPRALTVSVVGDLIFRRDFALAGGSTVRGVVRDAQRPLAASLVVTDQSGAVVTQVHADSEGRFAIAGLAQGDTVAVTASVPGYQPTSQLVTVDASSHNGIELLLVAIGGVQGSVRTADGTPLEGATVSAIGPEQTIVASVTTDADGRYRIEGLTDAQFTIVANMYEPAAVQVQVVAGERNVADIGLGAGRSPAVS
ncbi:MFS transporter [Gordonia insulae]|uniref:Riboflavin transporter RibZ n=1 Tax=Gordonia insulae TaxID=2420509 RepID=A0A3G8JRJ4_9ACTN|nr:MFS transporter [Gordonia insulae]AZG47548.1 Riboflavin transporter RibZ [Gordonia insulae]